jgi:spore coat protein U-like protein
MQTGIQLKRRCPTLKYPVSALILCALANPLHAATTTSTFTVQMTVTSSCVINSSSTLSFGSQGVLGANVDNTSTIQVQCTNTTPYNIGLDAGTGTGATVTTRKMSNGANTINYSLYSDSGRATVWGNTIGTNTVAATGSGASQSYTVYGRVPPQTTPAAATYTDTITVTVTY